MAHLPPTGDFQTSTPEIACIRQQGASCRPPAAGRRDTSVSGENVKKHQKRFDLITLIFFSVLTGVAISQIQRIHVDSSIEVFIPRNHQIYSINDRIEEEFGSLDSIMLGLRVSFGSVLEPEILGLIESLTTILEEDPSIERVISLSNADYIVSSREGIEVVPLLGDLSTQSIETLKDRLVDWQDVYIDTIVSSDYKLAVLVIQPVADLSDAGMSSLYDRIIGLTEGYESANLAFPIAGFPVVKQEINTSVTTDITFLIPVVAVLILGILFVAFRRLEGVLLPLISLLVAGVWVVGLLALFGITFTMATMLVPVLLLVVGSAYGIHVMSHFYHDVSHAQGHLNYSEVCAIVRASIGKIRLSVILAGATTAGGFLSQLSSPLGPFRAFGVLSAVGVVFSQVAALVLIPALLRLRYGGGIDTEKFHNNRSLKERTTTPKIFVILERLVRRGKWPVALLSILFIALTVIAIPGINIGTNMIDFFRPDSSLVQDTTVFNEKLSGTGIVSVMIEAPESGDILRPEFLRRLDRFAGFVSERHEHVPGIQTVVPNIKRINMIMNYDSVPYEAAEEEEPVDFDFFGGGFDAGTAAAESVTDAASENEPATLSYEELAGMFQKALLVSGTDPTSTEFIDSFLSLKNFQGAAFYEVPEDPAKYGLDTEEELKELITQYLVLYSGSLDYVINDTLEPDRTLITLQLDRQERDVINPLLKDIEAYWGYYLDEEWRISTGGTATLALVLSELVTQSQYYSLAGALLIVWIIVSILFRSPFAGLIGLIPVAYALFGIFSLMAALNFNLDVITSLLAALAIGVGVDYAIHYMNAYKRCLADGAENPLNTVYKTTGSAILFNATSVAVGFLGLLISRFIPIQQLGVLFSVSMVFACLASLIVLPMVIEITKPRFLRR